MNDAQVNINTGTLQELLDKLMERKYTAKNLGSVSYRTLNYWHEQGLLLLQRDENERQWRKFSFAEIIWIRMLEEFRTMGIAVEKVAKPLMNHFGEEELDPEEWIEGVNFPMGSGPLTVVSSEKMHFQFCLVLAVCIHYRNPAAIRIFFDGTVTEVFANPDFTGIRIEEIHQKDYSSGFQSFISLSLDKIIMEVIPDLDIDTVLEFGVINQNEIELLKHMSRKELLNVLITNPDGEINKIEFKQQVVTASQTMIVYETLKNGMYHKITYQTIGGKTTIFEQTSKIKNDG
jgi:DNA-binding transcriptional MerR regulator